jgi:putative phosphoesterase
MMGILSDAHGNADGFQCALNRLQKSGAESFIFLGDSVGYICSPAVVERLRALGGKVACVRGNHEDMLLRDRYPASRDEIYQLKATKARLSQADLDFMSSWPLTISQAFPCGSALFVHGSPVDPLNGYVYEDSSLEELGGDADFIFMGHTHRPFVRRKAAQTFVNVGSCGLPRDDGRFGAAALFDPESGKIEIIRFEIAQATAATLAGLPPVHPSVEGLFRRRAPEGKATHDD